MRSHARAGLVHASFFAVTNAIFKRDLMTGEKRPKSDRAQTNKDKK